jgi:hypothetical protein
LVDRENALPVVFLHELGSHPVQEAEVVFFLCLRETECPEGTEGAMLIQNDERGIGWWICRPDLEGIDDGNHVCHQSWQLNAHDFARYVDKDTAPKPEMTGLGDNVSDKGEPYSVLPSDAGGAENKMRLIPRPFLRQAWNGTNQRIGRGMKRTSALIVIAKKLLRIIHAMVRDDRDYLHNYESPKRVVIRKAA